MSRARRISIMEKLVVDAEGKLIIPAHILAERGLRPGDGLTLVEADEGLLIYQHGHDSLTARRGSGLSEDERRQAQLGAERYESLSEVGRDRVWGERTQAAEVRAEGDKLESPPTRA